MKQASYPSVKNAGDIHFKLNSDDFSASDVRKVASYLRKNGIEYTYYRIYSKIKLMSWGVFRISTNENVTFPINEIHTQSILNAVFPESAQPIGIGSSIISEINRDVLSYAKKFQFHDFGPRGIIKDDIEDGMKTFLGIQE